MVLENGDDDDDDIVKPPVAALRRLGGVTNWGQRQFQPRSQDVVVLGVTRPDIGPVEAEAVAVVGEERVPDGIVS